MLGKWTVRRSSRIHRDRWISLRADVCVTLRGVEVAPYYVLEYPDFAHALCLDSQNRVVLVKQYRHGAGEFSLELPGGCVDATDSDPLAAAMRELREETGYVADTGRLIASLTVDPAKFSNRIHLVLVENAKPSGCRRLDEGEDMETVLVRPETLLSLALSGGILNAGHVGMAVIGLRAAGLLKGVS